MKGRYQVEIFIDYDDEQFDQQCFDDEQEAKQYLIKAILDINEKDYPYEHIIGKVYDQEEYDFILTMMMRCGI